MKRRDFLRLRSSGGQTIMMLSCHRLYVHYNDARSAMNNLGSEYCSDAEDWWSGEPPLSVETRPVEQLFGELRQEVEHADVLVLEDREWLQDDRFSSQVEQLLAACRAQGGEIRYSTKNSMSPV